MKARYKGGLGAPKTVPYIRSSLITGVIYLVKIRLCSHTKSPLYPDFPYIRIPYIALSLYQKTCQGLASTLFCRANPPRRQYVIITSGYNEVQEEKKRSRFIAEEEIDDDQETARDIYIDEKKEINAT